MTSVYLHGRRSNHHEQRRAALPLVLLIALGLTGCAALAYVASVLWPHWPASGRVDAPSLPVTVAGVSFNVPRAAIRIPLQRQSGAHARLDLSFQWPSLRPPSPRPTIRLAPHTIPRPQILKRLFVTIVPADGALTPSARISTIYPHYAASAPIAGPNGLAILAFRNGTPYQGEDLIYDGAEPEKFVVRCTRNGPEPTPGMCLYARRIAAVDITVRFPRDWLADWRAIGDKIEQLIATLRSPQSSSPPVGAPS